MNKPLSKPPSKSLFLQNAYRSKMPALCLLYNSFADNLPWTVCAKMHLTAAVAVAMSLLVLCMLSCPACLCALQESPHHQIHAGVPKWRL